MYKVETMPLLARKAPRACEGYLYVRKWAEDNQFKAHYKLDPSRNTMIIFDEKSFEYFKKTFKIPWKLVF
jgi:hypothetical protein